jgi:hypothetical protein
MLILRMRRWVLPAGLGKCQVRLSCRRPGRLSTVRHLTQITCDDTSDQPAACELSLRTDPRALSASVCAAGRRQGQIRLRCRRPRTSLPNIVPLSNHLS